jgi:diguanylate cyclase (GGDEF)-like protein
MKRLITAFTIAFALIPAAHAGADQPLATLHAVHALSHAQAAKRPSAVFEATVTYRRQNEGNLFVQEGDEGIYVWADASIRLSPGDRVLIRGKAQDSFRPIVFADSVTLLHHGSLPKPTPATFDDLVRAQRDCQRVSIRGVIQSADLGLNSDQNDTHLVLLTDGGAVDAYVNIGDANVLDQLLDADVEVSGVAQMKFDGKMQQTGVALSVPSIADVKILKRAETSPWSLPTTEMDEIITGYRVKNISQRIRVHGTVTYYQPGSGLVLQSGAKSLWIRTIFEKPLRIGYQADVIGFPDAHDNFLTLTDGEVRESSDYTPVPPQPVTRSQLTSSKHIFDLISIRGRVVMEVRENSQDEYVLVSEGQVFSAVYRHPDVEGLQPMPMKQVPIGSTVSITGICILEGSNPFGREVPFDILMRSPDDIAVVGRPSLLSVRNLSLLVGLLLVGIFSVGIRGWAIERRVRRQNAALAYIERRRGRILEDINGTRALTEIIEDITELVSFKLRGAPCWFQMDDDALLGNCPHKLNALRIVEHPIPARSGAPLGIVFAAFDPLTTPDANEAEALAMAVGLAALAFETRRLYSDLLHRSEFDLLTDIHNRFSLEKCLEQQIDKARQNTDILGLIYIDLDGFKQVNDVYGHQTGDLYLQQVALRMKHQLRPVDLLARLGGDEFAVLVPDVQSRAAVKEIAMRLEHCFEDPFAVGKHTLRGAASVGIAMYPVDAATADALLSAADAAMYAAKNSRREMLKVNSLA